MSTSAIVNIEDTVNVYGDIYKINKENFTKLATRTDLLENKVGIDTSPELKIMAV